MLKKQQFAISDVKLSHLFINRVYTAVIALLLVPALVTAPLPTYHFVCVVDSRSQWSKPKVLIEADLGSFCKKFVFPDTWDGETKIVIEAESMRRFRSGQH